MNAKLDTAAKRLLENALRSMFLILSTTTRFLLSVGGFRCRFNELSQLDQANIQLVRWISAAIRVLNIRPVLLRQTVRRACKDNESGGERIAAVEIVKDLQGWKQRTWESE